MAYGEIRRLRGISHSSGLEPEKQEINVPACVPRTTAKKSCCPAQAAERQLPCRTRSGSVSPLSHLLATPGGLPASVVMGICQVRTGLLSSDRPWCRD